MVYLSMGGNRLVMARRKHWTIKKMAKPSSTLARIGNPELIELRTKMHRKEIENASEMKITVGGKWEYWVWKAITKADAMQLVIISLGQFSFLWYSGEVTAEANVILVEVTGWPSPASAISGPFSSVDCCCAGGGGGDEDGDGFSNGDDGDGLNGNIFVKLQPRKLVKIP